MLRLPSPRRDKERRKEMTPEKQQLAIAEWVGWSRIEMSSGNISSGKQLLGNWVSKLYGTPPEDKDKQLDDQRFQLVPDYLNDLNAIHEVEKKLGDKAYLYTIHLIRVLHWSAKTDATFVLIHATAAQRCNAMCHALGLWKRGD